MMQYKRIALTELKADGDERGTFSGYGAVFGNVDSYGDVIDRGAFARTLSEWRTKGKWPKMLLQHGGMGLTTEDLVPIGQWVEMEENRKGLKVQGRLFGLNTDKGQYLYEGVKSGELDGLSIGFQTVGAQDEVIDGETVRHLTDIELWEVSLVTFPANQQALVSSVKTFTGEQWRELENGVREAGFSRRDSQLAVAALRKYLLREAGEPEARMREAAPSGVSEADLLEAAKSLVFDLEHADLLSNLGRFTS